MADIAGAVSSPCIGVCRIDAGTDWCEGCLRSLAEIAAWGASSDDDKRALLARLPRRRVERRARRREAKGEGAT